jgi:transcriptional regulator with XRE-family HTH domain
MNLLAFAKSPKIGTMRLNAKLQKLCGGHGKRLLSQRELAHHVGESKSTVNRWFKEPGEKDATTPNLAQALRLARVLGVTLEYLADDELDVEPPSAEPSRDEHLVLETFHSIGIPVREAVRRLHGGDDAVIVAFRELQITPEEAIRRMRGGIVAGPSREEPKAGRKTGGEGGKPDIGGKKKGVS